MTEPIPPLSSRYLILSALSGAVWGAIGYALAASSFPALILPAVLLSPLIGLAVGIGFRWIHRFEGIGVKAFVALLSLYAAGMLFGLVIGFTDLARGVDLPPGTTRIGYAVVIQPVMAIWWGLTFGGWFLALWPLAYLNHRLLGNATVTRA